MLLRFGRRRICVAGSGLATLLMGAVGGLVLARDAGAHQHQSCQGHLANFSNNIIRKKAPIEFVDKGLNFKWTYCV